MIKIKIYVGLVLFIIGVHSITIKAQFSVIDVHLTGLNGIGIDAGYSNSGTYIGFGYSFSGVIPYGENYTETVSYITFPEDIRSEHTNRHLLELKYGELFESLTLPYVLVGIGWKNTLQQRFDELRILDVDGDYFITYDDEIILNIGLGIRQRFPISQKSGKYFSIGLESSYHRLFVVSIGWAVG